MPAKTDTDICRECWPYGWPDLDGDAPATGATCEHGEWSRPAPKKGSS